MQTSQTIPLPPLPPGAPRNPGPGRYREQYGLILRATDEADQKRLFDQLVAQGLKPRVVTT